MRIPIPGACLLLLTACVSAPPHVSREQAQHEVEATERAFAKTMADRDHAAFTTFLAEETVFFGDKEALHGKAQVAASMEALLRKASRTVFVGAGPGRSARLGHARAEYGAGAWSRWQDHRDFQFDLAPRSVRGLAHRVRQGE